MKRRSDSETWTDEVEPEGEIALPVVHEPGQGFVVEEVVGTGATGVVHAALDRDLDRKVAVKVLGERALGRLDLQARFLAEARITSKLDHPGVVPIHALHRTEDGRLAYAMKLVRGVTLRDALLQPAPPPLAARLELFLKICDAVHYAHDQGVVHRDLKPENIMVGDHGEAWVMDWGVAIDADEETPTGRVYGTPGFLAPEQALGEPVDARCDQYALALVLQEIVTLADAVTGDNAMVRLAKNQRSEREAMPQAPTELVAIVERAAALRPEDRYPSVRALAEDVRRYLRGEAVEARPDTPFQAAARWLGRHREGALVALGLLGLLVALIATGAQVQLLRERAEAEARQAELATLVADVAGRAGAIDGRLVRLEGLLGEIVAVAEERLAHGTPVTGRQAWAADFDAGTVPDQRHAPYYGLPISVTQPVFLHPEGPRPEAAARLLPLGDVLASAVLRSTGASEATRWEAVGVRGAPLAWASVAFEDGLGMSYPGHGGFPSGYDPRERPWYTLGSGWGAPYLDSGGLGLLLPCSAPVRVNGEQVGVASIKLPLDRLIGDLLEWPDAESYLLDGEGRVAVRASARGWRRGEAILDNEAVAMPLFDVPEVVEAARDGRAVAVSRGDRLVVAHPLHTLGWAYVIATGSR